MRKNNVKYSKNFLVNKIISLICNLTVTETTVYLSNNCKTNSIDSSTYCLSFISPASLCNVQRVEIFFMIVFRLAFSFIFSFYLYIYPPDSQESDRGANTYQDLLPEMPRYCCPLEIFLFWFFSL